MTQRRATGPRALVLAVLLSAAPAAFAGPEIVELEDAIEAYSVELNLSAGGRGTALVRECPRCEPVKLALGKASRAYRKGKEVPLQRAVRLVDADAVVFFTIADRTVSRIVW